MSDSPRTDKIMGLVDDYASGDGMHESARWAKLRAEVELLEMELVEALDDLKFVERWSVHHASKKIQSPEAILGVIANYPAIQEITKSYEDVSI